MSYCRKVPQSCSYRMLPVKGPLGASVALVTPKETKMSFGTLCSDERYVQQVFLTTNDFHLILFDRNQTNDCS